MATFHVRQKLTYYEDFVVEAESGEDAIEQVNDGAVDGQGPEYLDCIGTYLVDENGCYSLEGQPDNAFFPSA